MIEIWKNIKGYEGKYQVSNFGRVKSLDYKRSGIEKLLTPSKNKQGRYRIILYKDGNYKHFQIHRLVYEAFSGEIPDGLQVNHIDENPLNCSISNLNLMTAKENCNWGTHNERCKKSLTNHPQLSKPVVAIQNEIIKLLFLSANEGGRNGYNFRHIVECSNGKRKTHKGYQWQYVDDYLADWWDKEMEKGA